MIPNNLIGTRKAYAQIPTVSLEKGATVILLLSCPDYSRQHGNRGWTNTKQFIVSVPSSVIPMVECSVSESMTKYLPTYFQEVRLELLTTNPPEFLNFVPFPAWEKQLVRTEDSGKSAVTSHPIANSGPETDCMIADTNGIFSSIADFSPCELN